MIPYSALDLRQEHRITLVTRREQILVNYGYIQVARQELIVCTKRQKSICSHKRASK